MYLVYTSKKPVYKQGRTTKVMNNLVLLHMDENKRVSCRRIKEYIEENKGVYRGE